VPRHLKNTINLLAPSKWRALKASNVYPEGVSANEKQRSRGAGERESKGEGEIAREIFLILPIPSAPEPIKVTPM
jgi:hypothetical protein